MWHQDSKAELGRNNRDGNQMKPVGDTSSETIQKEMASARGWALEYNGWDEGDQGRLKG